MKFADNNNNIECIDLYNKLIDVNVKLNLVSNQMILIHIQTWKYLKISRRSYY